MSTAARTAMVLAAGRSTRLMPLTADIAKPALPFVGVPVLHRVLDGLEQAGVERVIVNLHHAPETVREVVLRRGGRMEVTFSDETRLLLGTAGALIPVKSLLRDTGPFLLVNGDCVHSLDYDATLAAHRAGGAAATLAVRARGVPGFGALRADASGLVETFSSPVTGDRAERHFLSVQVVEPELLDLLPDEPRPMGTFTDWYPTAIRDGHAFRVHVTDEEWHALDTPRLYLEATRDWLARRDAGPFVDVAATVDPTARLDPACAVHAGCRVGRGAVLEGSVMMPGAQVGRDARVTSTLVGFDARIDDGAVVSDRLVAGQAA